MILSENNGVFGMRSNVFLIISNDLYNYRDDEIIRSVPRFIENNTIIVLS